jgi:hypothetical protein
MRRIDEKGQRKPVETGRERGFVPHTERFVPHREVYGDEEYLSSLRFLGLLVRLKKVAGQARKW